MIFLIISCWSVLCLDHRSDRADGYRQLIIEMVPRSGIAFHKRLLDTVLGSPMSFFASTDTGVTLNRFSQDLMLIDMELPVSALNTFASKSFGLRLPHAVDLRRPAFILCIAQMILIAVAAPFATISFPVVGGSVYFIQRFYLRTSRQLRFLDLEAKSPLYTQFNEMLEGLATIRAFGWQSFLGEKAIELLDRSQLVLDLIVAAVATILIILVVVLNGKLSAGYVGVALLNVILFSQSIKLLIHWWTQLETHIGSVARIKTFTTDAISEDQEEEDQVPPPNWPSDGKIEFRDVTACYRSVYSAFTILYADHLGPMSLLSPNFPFRSRQARRLQSLAAREGKSLILPPGSSH
jgi:ATP-binding cassette subfamily C (CFTR/MRP) protein 1